jgi:glycerophosphoryl diester phosphodiesterase
MATRHFREIHAMASRGASGYRPEQTLEAYRLAIRQGADYIERPIGTIPLPAAATFRGVLMCRRHIAVADITP